MPLQSWAALFAGTPPSDLGAPAGRLKPCPDTPNCVNSQATGAHAVAPIAFADSPLAALQRMARVLESMPRTRIVERTAGYLRAEASSRIFGFVDDVELLLDAEARVLHVRSASRLGYSDLGVNRRRIEAIRAAFEASSGT